MSGQTPLWADVDQAIWLTKRKAGHRRSSGRYPRIWSSATIAELETMVGHYTVREMAEHFHLQYCQVSAKLIGLGYKVTRDVHNPLGRDAYRAAKIIGVPYEWLWKQIRAGKITCERVNRKRYFLRWPLIKALHRRVQRHRDKREKLLDRIKVATISETMFARMINLSLTQTNRYLKGKIVKAWKIPLLYADGAHPDRWEWMVSKPDAERVTKLRQEGRLRLRKKKYREATNRENAKVTKLRKERRLGHRPDLGHRFSCIIPGFLSVAAVSAQAGVSESQVYTHIRTGRLPAKHQQVGNRNYTAVDPVELPKYLKWVKQDWKVKQRGPRPTGRKCERDQVAAAGYLTIMEACKRYPETTEEQLRDAVAHDRIPSKRIGRLIALKQRDVRMFVKIARRWKEMKANARSKSQPVSGPA